MPKLEPARGFDLRLRNFLAVHRGSVAGTQVAQQILPVTDADQFRVQRGDALLLQENGADPQATDGRPMVRQFMPKNQTIGKRADQKTHSPGTVGISLNLLGVGWSFEAGGWRASSPSEGGRSCMTEAAG